jgi:cytoskeletal protein CcmA (bactofilin family)
MLFNRKSDGRDHPAPDPAPEASKPPEPPPAFAEASRHAGSDTTPTQSFIDASLTIVGDLHSQRDVQIDGRICGNVTCAQLIVGGDAVITGTVKASQAVVRGSIKGTIRASAVILQETARVDSDITYSMLAIDDGAQFEGTVRRSESPLAETRDTSPLAELQRTIAAVSPGTAAAPSAGRNEAACAPESGLGSASPDHRNANGHAETQR